MFTSPRTTVTAVVVGVLSIYLISCSPESTAPNVEDLIKVDPPTFGNSTNTVISSPTISYTLSGTCDTNAYQTEYSFDKSNWINLDCINASFQIPLTVTSYITIYARSKGKFSYTDVSSAVVRFLLPPTSPSLMAVASSRSDASDNIGVGTQNTLNSSFAGVTFSDGSKQVFTGIPRMTYEGP